MIPSKEQETLSILEVENAYLAQVVVRLREALEVSLGRPGYEALDADERATVATQAMRLIPVDIDARRRGDGLDRSKPLTIPGEASVYDLPVPTAYAEAADALSFTTVAHLRACGRSMLDDLATTAGIDGSLIERLIDEGRIS